MCELAEEKLVIQIVFYSKEIYSNSFHSIGCAVFHSMRDKKLAKSS